MAYISRNDNKMYVCICMCSSLCMYVCIVFPPDMSTMGCIDLQNFMNMDQCSKICISSGKKQYLE